MKKTISAPLFQDVLVVDMIKKMQELGETCRNVKKYYPNVWDAVVKQFKLQYSFDKTISNELFEKKLEVLFLEDDENRNKKS